MRSYLLGLPTSLHQVDKPEASAVAFWLVLLGQEIAFVISLIAASKAWAGHEPCTPHDSHNTNISEMQHLIPF
jgi:hypothetical protein